MNYDKAEIREILNSNKKDSKWLFYIYYFVILAIMPTVVLLKVINLNGNLAKMENNNKHSFDFFSYYKMNILIVTSIIILITLVYMFIVKEIKIKKDKILILSLIYAITIVVSTILSEYKDIAVWGFAERFEGAVTLIAYIILFTSAYIIIDNKKMFKLILFSLLFSLIIIGLIGISQFFGKDFFASSIGRNLMIPSKYANIADNLKFNFGENIIYGTLYNPNYVGSYMAMLFGLVFGLYLLINSKKKKIICGIFLTIILVNLIGSNSRAGLLGTIVMTIVALIFMRKKIRKNIMWIVMPILLFAIIFVGLNIKSQGQIGAKFKTLFTDMAEVFDGKTDASAKEGLGSSRLYIWSNSVPILKQTVLVGKGPDTFVAYFPQKDPHFIMDKPHNMYIQIAISTGWISLIAVIAIFAIYLIKSFKIYFRNNFDNFYEVVGLGILLAVIGYLVAGFFNDSVVSVAPIFWVLLGCGFSVNNKLTSFAKTLEG